MRVHGVRDHRQLMQSQPSQCCGKGSAHSGSAAIPGQVVLGDIKRVADYETGNKPAIGIPSWSLLQSLPAGSCLSPWVTDCG